jgi:nitrogen fixation protein NifB
MLVNQHLGEASDFYIFGLDSEKIKLVGKRKAPLPGSGDFRWIQLAKTLSDCNTILVSGAGANPTSMLKSMKINVVQMNGLIESGLDAVFNGKSLKVYQKTTFKCGDSCEGNAQGCL